MDHHHQKLHRHRALSHSPMWSSGHCDDYLYRLDNILMTCQRVSLKIDARINCLRQISDWHDVFVLSVNILEDNEHILLIHF